jgi:hypothetical protein
MENSDFLGRRGMKRGIRLSQPNGGRIQALGGDIVAAKSFSRKQAIFNEKASQYANSGVITTPGFLRLETIMPNSAVSVFNFNTLDTSGTKTVTERRLKLSDTFTVTDIAFYIGYGAATAFAPTPAQYATQKLTTFPNPRITSLGANAANMEAIYNGYLSLRVDTTTFIDSIPMKQFYRAGTSQAGVAVSTQATTGVLPADEFPLSMYGRSELLPSIELNGQSNIEFSITLPTATNCAAVADNFTNCVLILQGFLNQGAATTQRNLQRRLR